MIRDLHDKLINGETTSVKITEEYFDVIEKKNKSLNVYLTLTKEKALKKAEKVDKKISAGGGSAFGGINGEEISLLEGIPGAIKDNICIKGERTTAGSKILDNYISPYSATVVKKLEETGAVILGKTNLDEFAMGSSTENSAYGPTKNPHDLERVPGGSSGGSAAAVAAGMASWALGSDTGGSIRQPASFCGVVGLKPTYGRVSRYGLMAMASSFDQIGPLTHTVEDAAIVLSAISGRDRMDGTSTPSFDKKFEDYLTGEVKGMKIGIVKEYMENLNKDVRMIMEEAIEKYKKMGAEICEVEFPTAKFSLPAYYIIQSSEASSNLARYDGIKYGARTDDKKKTKTDADGLPQNLLETYLDTKKYNLGTEVKRRIMLGTYSLSSGYYDAYYLRAQKTRMLIKKDLERIFKRVDLIFMPTSPTPAFKIGEKTNDPLEMYLSDIFTVTANITGVPAISIPAGKISAQDLPVGFQLMGKWFDEENLLRAADAWERIKI